MTGIVDQNWSIVDGLESGDLLTGGSGNNTLYGTIQHGCDLWRRGQ